MFLGRPVNLWAGLFALIGSTIVAIAAIVVPSDQLPPIAAIVGSLVALASGVVTFLAGQPPVVNEGGTVNVHTPAGQPNQLVQVNLPPGESEAVAEPVQADTEDGAGG